MSNKNQNPKQDHSEALNIADVSGSVFHPAISHVNCDENISKETVNAINKMVDCVIKNDIKNEK